MSNFGDHIARNQDTELIITALNGATAVVKAEVFNVSGVTINSNWNVDTGSMQSTGAQHGASQWRFRTNDNTRLIGFNVMVTPGMAQEYTFSAELRQKGQTVWMRTHSDTSFDRRPKVFAFSADIS